MSGRTRLKQWWLEHVWHRLVLPLGEPVFFTGDEDDIAKRMYVKDPAAAEALLAQAKGMDEGIDKTKESIEARAMTLQGAVAIATTLALAAGALLLDRTKIPSHGWRIALAVALTFILSGLRALGASSRTHPWAFPGYEDIFDHAKMRLAASQAARTAAYLKSVGLNERIVSVKGGYLNAAVFWFRVALALLLASAVMLLVYSVRDDPRRANGATARAKPVAHARPTVRSCRDLRVPQRPQCPTEGRRRLPRKRAVTRARRRHQRPEPRTANLLPIPGVSDLNTRYGDAGVLDGL